MDGERCAVQATQQLIVKKDKGNELTDLKRSSKHEAVIACYRIRDVISVGERVVEKAIRDGLTGYSCEAALKRKSGDKVNDDESINSMKDHNAEMNFLDSESSESDKHKEDEGGMAVQKSSNGNGDMNFDGQTRSKAANGVFAGSSSQEDVTSACSFPIYCLASGSTKFTAENLLRDEAAHNNDMKEESSKLLNRLSDDPLKPNNEARAIESSSSEESFCLQSSTLTENGIFPVGTQDKCKVQLQINDQNNKSLQSSIDSHVEELGSICEELSDLFLDIRFENKESKEQIKFAVACIAGMDSLEATEVANLNGLVEELQGVYLQLVQSHKRKTEQEGYKIDVNEATVLETDPGDATRRNRLEDLVEKCRVLGSVIAKLGCSIIDDSIKNKEVHRQQHRAMKKKVRQLNKSFSEALEERDEKLQKLIKTSTQMKECIDDAQSEKTSIEALINSITRENEKLQDQDDTLKEQQTSQREAHQEELDNMAAQEKFREREISNLRKDLQRKESQIDELRREYDTALAREKAVICSVEEVNSEYNKQYEHLKEVELYLTDVERDAEKLRKEIVHKGMDEDETRDSTNCEIRMKNERPEMSLDTVKVCLRKEDEALEGYHSKTHDPDTQTGYEVSKCPCLQNCVLRKRFHFLKRVIVNAAATLGYSRKKVITLQSESQKMKVETLRLQKAIEGNRRYKPITTSLCREDTEYISSDCCTACYHAKGCCGLTPQETMFDQTHNVYGKPERGGILRDREWSLIKEMKDENLKASWFLTNLQTGKHGTLKIIDKESVRDDNMVVEAYQEELCSTFTNQRYGTDQGNSANCVHHIRLLQTDLDDAREELLQKNKEVRELRRSTTLLEMKLNEQDLTEQGLRSNIEQLTTRCQDLERDNMSSLRRSKSPSITQRFAGQLL